MTISCLPADRGSNASIFNGVRLHAHLMPAGNAASGGDWCEALVVSRDVVALSIGDVCGHGPGVSDAMLAIRQVVRDASYRRRNPSQTLADANAFVCAFDPHLHATALLAFLNTRTRTLSFASAGHPPPLVVGRGGARFLRYGASEVPLGVQRALEPTLRVSELAPATLLVLYTDGVTERERRPIEGAAWLRETALQAYRHAAPAAILVDKLMLLTKFGSDDAAVLAASLPGAEIGLRPRRA